MVGQQQSTRHPRGGLGQFAAVTDRIVVIDSETTGIFNRDRIVEIAAVTLDLSGRVIGRWETLVNPGRDVGPTWIHRITPSMLVDAPTWADIAHDFADLLDGAVVCAHNLPFDARMVAGEYRLIGRSVELASGLDTYAVTRLKLPDACARAGIVLRDGHCAINDAAATARLLAHVAPGLGDVRVEPFASPYRARRTAARVLPRDRTARGCGPTAAGIKNARDLLRRAATVCFTGTAVDASGRKIDRAELRSGARQLGLGVEDWISRSVDVLIAADAATQSSKADKARWMRIPIIDVATFLAVSG